MEENPVTPDPVIDQKQDQALEVINQSPADRLLERVKQQQALTERQEKANKEAKEISNPVNQKELYLYCKSCSNYFTRWSPVIPQTVICKCGSTSVMLLRIDKDRY